MENCTGGTCSGEEGMEEHIIYAQPTLDYLSHNAEARDNYIFKKRTQTLYNITWWWPPLGEISSDLYRALVRDMKKHVFLGWHLSKNPFAHS